MPSQSSLQWTGYPITFPPVTGLQIGKLANWRKSSGSALLCLLPLVLITGETAYSQCRVQLQLNRPDINTSICICHYPVCGTRADTGCRWCAHALHCTALDFPPCHRTAVSSAVHRLAGFKIALPPLTGLHYPVCGTGLQVCSTLCFTNMQPNFKMALHYPVRYREQSAHDDCRRYSLTTGNTGLQVC